MKAMTVTDFKAHALRVLGRVAKTRESIVINKREKPLAEVVPYTEADPSPGKLSEALVFENDIVSPLGEGMWDAAE